MKKIEKSFPGLFSFAFFLALASTSAWADFRFIDPKSNEFSKPTLPSMPKTAPLKPKTLSACEGLVYEHEEVSTEYDLFVLKLQGQRYGRIAEKSPSGQQSERIIPYVYTRTFTKDMLGQYSVAVDFAHALGITQVDSLRVYVLDPDPRLPKAIFHIYDEDGELLDRIGQLGDHWLRCR